LGANKTFKEQQGRLCVTLFSFPPRIRKRMLGHMFGSGARHLSKEDQQLSPDSVTMIGGQHASKQFVFDSPAPTQFQPPKFDINHVLDSDHQRKELVDHAKAHGAPQHHVGNGPTSKRKLPSKLPPLNQVLAESAAYVGPTRESNWVIPDRIMVGAYPSSFDDMENEQILRGLLECGITTFVCLQLEYQHGVPESQWRAGVSLRPYIEDALEICEKDRGKGAIVAPEDLKFLHHGIVDCGTTTDLTVLELALDICYRLLSDEVIYLHCWGGHGRTGTVVAVAIGLMYGLSSAEALVRTQLYHDLRVCSLNVPSPQTPQQRRQVERILDAVARGEYSNIVPPLPIISPSSPLACMPSPRFVKTIKRRASEDEGWANAQ
jgi:hypothetical protein